MLTLILSFSAKNKVALEHYNISQTGLRLIQAGILLPTLFIWTAMLFATYSFYRYSRQIDGSKDSQGFRDIAYGLTAVLVSSIIVSLISGLSVLMSEASADPVSTKRNFIIISNYVSVLSALAIYGYLYKGSRALLGSIGQTT